MSYKIDSYTLKQYVTDNWIKTPRFQRAKTWKASQKFDLVLSIFKRYPLGCVILCKERNQDYKFLIDGRQRYSTIQDILRSPDQIYEWSKKYLGISKRAKEAEIEKSFWQRVETFTDFSPNDDMPNDSEDNGAVDDNEEEGIENQLDISSESSDVVIPKGNDSLIKLLDFIKFCSTNELGSDSGLSAVFNFKKYIQNTSKFERRLEEPYSSGKSHKISTPLLKKMIEDFKSSVSENDNFVDTKNLKKEDFVRFVEDEYGFKDDEAKQRFSCEMLGNWDKKQRASIEFFDLFDNILSSSVIAVISVEDVGTLDEEKIFNLINSNGTPLTAAEILSSKPDWNKRIDIQNEEKRTIINSIYKDTLGLGVPDNYVRWDLPASLPFSLKKAENFDFLFPLSNIKNASASKVITLGFKISSGLLLDSIKKDDLDKLGSRPDITYENFDKIEQTLKNMTIALKEINYFRTFASWKLSLNSLIGDAPTLCFIFMVYHIYVLEGQPRCTENKFDLFKRNCFVLLDKLIYEYVRSQWRGSSDSTLAKELADFKKTYSIGQKVTPISKADWDTLLKEIMDYGTINNRPIAFSMVKPIIAHYNGIKGIKCDISYDFKPEFDHIIPQVKFGNKNDKTSARERDNIYNIALFPKISNASKNDKTLLELSSNETMVANIETFEEIKKADFALYQSKTDIGNLRSERGQKILEAFESKRDELLA